MIQVSHVNSPTMWNTVRLKGEECFLKITDLEGIYEFLLSNLKCIWKNKLSEREIVHIIHELNPHLEATPKVLVNKALTSLYERNSAEELDFTGEPCGITLKSVSMIGGFTFKFDLKLDLILHENLFHELTLPLLLMTRTLKERENKLKGIIRLKDKEIEDYRLGGAHLSHKMLQTKPFDEKEDFKETLDSKKIQEVIQSPAKYFSETLNELFESAAKEIAKYRGGEGSSNVVQETCIQHSPDMFDESSESEAKVMAVPKKMPNLLKVEVKPKRPRNQKSFKAPKKLQI